MGTPEKLNVEFDNITKLYSDQPRTKTFNAMVIGKPGTGKTFLLRTARQPVVIHSFDPGGTMSIRKWIRSEENPNGTIFADVRFEEYEPRKPTAYALWEKEVHRLASEGFFANVGTYVIDSATSWVSALIEEAMKRRGKVGEPPSLPDWGAIANTAIAELKFCTSLPCDFILIGHIDAETDSVTGRMETNIALTPKMRKIFPGLFDEIYVALTKETSAGLEYQLLTKNTGYYMARSRLAADGLLDTYERPYIKNILKKAGLDYADKAWLTEGGEKK